MNLADNDFTLFGLPPRQALRCITLRGKAVRMHLRLQSAPAAVDLGPIQGVPAGKIEQREIIVVKLHGRSQGRGGRRIRPGTIRRIRSGLSRAGCGT